MTWSAQIHGLDNLSEEMQAAARLGVHDGLEALGIRGEAMVVENITTPYQGHPPAVFTGNLAGSVMHQVEDLDQGAARLWIGVGPSLGADVYAAPVETGARPHMPPASALVPWVTRHFNPESEKQALSLAFAVAKSIAKKGTPGHEMFSRADVDLEGEAVSTLEHAVAQALLRLGGGNA